VNSAAELLGTCIGGVVTLLSLSRVVLGGGLTEAVGQPFVDLVKKAARREAFPERCRQVKVVMTKLLDEAGIIGSALIAAERLAGRTP
jgi:predicted NBD/HSP70 family sugar kinase